MEKIIFFDVDNAEETFFRDKCIDKYIPIFSKAHLNEHTELTEEMFDAEAISTFVTSNICADVLDKFPKLRLLALRSAGFNHVDLEFCHKNNLELRTAKGYGNRSIAEFTIGLMIDCSRRISQSYFDLKDQDTRRKNYTGEELLGKTLGVIGVGEIGAEILRLAKVFGMNILGYDFLINDKLIKEIGLKYTSLDDLLMISDFVSLNCPLTKENFHLINQEKLALMKERAFLINTARGELIDTEALFKALSFNSIGGAALDVLECEFASTCPNFLYDEACQCKDCLKEILLNRELFRLDNVIVTPHIAYDTAEAKANILNITMENINLFFGK